MARRASTRATIGLLLMPLLLAALACNAQFGSTQPTAVAQGPSVQFIAPENNSVIAEGTQLTFAVNVTNPGGISKVDFQVDDAPLGSQNAPSPDLTTFSAQQVWTAVGIQGHFVSAIVFDKDGKAVGDAKLTLTVVAKPGSSDATEAATVSDSGSLPTLAATTGTQATLVQSSDTSNNAAPTLVQQNNAAPTIPPTNTPAPTPERAVTFVIATPEQPMLAVKAPNLNIRSGDATSFQIIGAMKTGDVANIIGRNAARSWWYVQKDQARGWVIADPTFSTATGDLSKVPLVASPPTPVPTNAPAAPAAATSTAGPGPDLVFDSVALNPSSPKVNQTFSVTIVIRNQGTVDAGSSYLIGTFQPGNEVSPVGVPAIKAGEKATFTMPVTLKSAGNSQTGVLTLDSKNEVNEGPNGEANNTFTVTYNVTN